MEAPDNVEPLLPSTLLEEVEAAAARENRSAREMLRKAVERYLRDRRSEGTSPSLTARQAADRMLARRRHHLLPDGVSIRDLMIHGRS